VSTATLETLCSGCRATVTQQNGFWRDSTGSAMCGLSGDIHQVSVELPPVAILTSGVEPLVHGLIVDEFLALATDEGQNSSNGWRLREHFNHGLDRLVSQVDGVLIRHSVVEGA